MSATPEHWLAIFRGALLSIAGCARCTGGPNLQCRRCRVDLAAAGLAAFHLVGASCALESPVDVSAEAERIATRPAGRTA